MPRMTIESALGTKVRALRRRQHLTQAALARQLGISTATLQKRFGAELERGLPGGRRQGRPQWRPSEAERAEVMRLTAAGEAQDRVAEVLGVSSPTLRRHCRAELSRGLELRASGVDRSQDVA